MTIHTSFTWGTETYELDVQHPLGQVLMSTYSRWNYHRDELRSKINSVQRDAAWTLQALDAGQSVNGAGIFQSTAARADMEAAVFQALAEQLTALLWAAKELNVATLKKDARCVLTNASPTAALDQDGKQ